MLFKHEGKVSDFNGVIRHYNWISYTNASSYAQAQLFFTYKYKKEFGIKTWIKISLENIEKYDEKGAKYA